MNTLREAAQQALEALETISTCYVGDHDSAGECASCHESSYLPHAPDCKKQNAITALRAALAQPEQEPVAWNSVGATSLEFETECSDGTRFLNVAEMPSHAVRWRIVAPPRREWRGLTMQEINALPEVGGRMWNMGVAEAVLQAIRAVEAALKERNNG